MGVEGLWQLVTPVGRRISIESLAHKVLAIDASIWLVQFVKAMRDDEGNMIENAHIIGSLRRICRLLFHRVRPVFVFDGGTPSIKYRTLAVRRKFRATAEYNVSKTAQKLLMNVLKRRRLELKRAATSEQRTGAGSTASATGSAAAGFVLPVATRSQGASSSAPNPASSSDRVVATGENSNSAIKLFNSSDEEESDSESDSESEYDEDEDEDVFDGGVADKLDFGALKHLPIGLQRKAINSAKRKIAREGRQEYQGVKDDIASFSSVQMKNFLKSSELNLKVKTYIKSLGNTEEDGRRIEGDVTREYILKRRDTDGGRTMLPADGYEEAAQDVSDGHAQVHGDRKREGTGKVLKSKFSVDSMVKSHMNRHRRSAKKMDERPRSSALSLKVQPAADKDIPSHGWSDCSSDDGSDGSSWGESEGGATGPATSATENREFLAPGASNVSVVDLVDDAAALEENNLMQTSSACTESAAALTALRESELARTEKSAHPILQEAMLEKEPGAGVPSSVSSFVKQTADERVTDSLGSPKRARPAAAPTVDMVAECTGYPEPLEIEEGSPLHRPLQKARSLHDVLDLTVDPVEDALGYSPSVSSGALKGHLFQEAGGQTNEAIDVTGEGGGAPDSSSEPSHNSVVPRARGGQTVDMQRGQRSVAPPIRAGDLEVGVVEVAKAFGGATTNVVEATNAMGTARTDVVDDAEWTKRQAALEDERDWAPISVVGTAKAPESADTDVGKTGEKDFEFVPPKPKQMQDEPGHRNKIMGDASAGSSIAGASSPATSKSPAIPATGHALGKRKAPDEREYPPTPSPAYHHSTVRHPKQFNSQGDEHRVIEELEALARENAALRSEHNRAIRDSEGVSSEMVDDVIEMLALFGLPYVVAPMEAEAQCAKLEQLGLVDGTITNDSDIFVFGGQHVYKNFFEERKYTECYNAKALEKELGLNRESLISMAELLGSDYAVGIKGVGIVNALEVVAAFGGTKENLQDFRDWLQSPNVDPRRMSAEELGQCSRIERFKYTHRNAKLRWIASHSFPSEQVRTAYMKPEVDDSEERFTWGTPNLVGLRYFSGKKLGWAPEYLNDMMRPVLDSMKGHRSGQTTLVDWVEGRAGVYRSARLRRAAEAIRQSRDKDIVESAQDPES